MGTYVYKAQSPEASTGYSELVDITIGGEPAKAAVAVYSYTLGNPDDDTKAYYRFAAPTERAWERWVEAGNNQPECIIVSDEIYHWPKGLWNFYDHAIDGFKKADAIVWFGSTN